MSDPPLICPPDAELKALFDGSLSEAQTDALSGHLENCLRCLESLERMAAGEDWPKEVAKHLSRRGNNGDSPERWEIPHRETSVRDPLERLEFLEPSNQPGVLGMLGPYEITETIGRGGFGIVLKGRDQRLNRVVAVKVLAPEWASNATARKRFLREAQAAAAVRHDHVVTIHAVDEVARLPYLVMEYIPGKSLQERLDETGPLEVRETLRIGRQIALGLAAAHAEGLIHRDIKPANILLEDGIQRVKITDFGLARAVDDVGMTQTGTVAGTPEYMSPEQAWGGVVDHRTDLFSLGGVLYAMCTGRSPFRAKSAMAVLKRVCEDEPRPIEEVNPEIPLSFVSIIEQLLAKDPNQRFASAQEVADLLGTQLAVLQNTETLIHVPREPKRVEALRPEVPRDAWSRLVNRLLCEDGLGGRLRSRFLRNQAAPVPKEGRPVRWSLVFKIGAVLAFLIPMVIVGFLETLEKRRWSNTAASVYPSSPQRLTPPPASSTDVWSPPLVQTNELSLDVSDATLQIAIDGQSYPVEAGGVHRVRLGDGEHTIAVAHENGRWFDEVKLVLPTSDNHLRIDGGGIIQSSAPTNVTVQWIPIDNYFAPLRFKGLEDVVLAPNYPGDGDPILAWDIEQAKAVPEMGGGWPAGRYGKSDVQTQIMALAKNGRFVALASTQSHSVELFDVENLRSSNWLTHMTVTQRAGNWTLELSPDGRLLFCASQTLAELFRLDGLVATKLGEIETISPPGVSNGIVKALFLPDGKHILLTDTIGNLELWKTQPFEREMIFSNLEFQWGRVHEMATDATGQRVLLTCPEKQHLVDLKQGKVLSEFSWPDNEYQHISHAAFLLDNRHVAFSVNLNPGGWENAELWIGDTQSGKITSRLNFQNALRTESLGVQFQDFRVSSDGKQITSLCVVHSEATQPNHAMAIVDWVVPDEAYKAEAETQENPNRLDGIQIQSHGMPGKVASLAITPDGKEFITGSDRETLASLHRFPGGQIVRQFQPNADVPQEPNANRFESCVAVSPDGQRIAGGQGSVLRLWNRETGEEEFAIGLRDPIEIGGQTLNRVHAIRSLVWSQDGKHLLMACPKSTGTAFAFLVQIETDKAKIIQRYEHPDDVNAAIFLGNGQRIATACRDGRARIWERDATKPTHELRANGSALLSLDATADGAYLATGSKDGSWHLWETRFGHRLNQWTGESAVASLKFLPQQNRLVTGHEDGHIALWDLSSPLEVGRTPASGSVTAMAVSPDGRHVLAGLLSKEGISPARVDVWTIPKADETSPLDRPKP